MINHIESCFAELLQLISLALIRLLNDISKKFNERSLNKLLLERGRFEHLMEGKHEKKVASESLEFALALLKNCADAETRIDATIVG